MTPPLMSMWMEPAGAQFACLVQPPRLAASIHFSNDGQPNI